VARSTVPAGGAASEVLAHHRPGARDGAPFVPVDAGEHERELDVCAAIAHAGRRRARRRTTRSQVSSGLRARIPHGSSHRNATDRSSSANVRRRNAAASPTCSRNEHRTSASPDRSSRAADALADAGVLRPVGRSTTSENTPKTSRSDLWGNWMAISGDAANDAIVRTNVC
jgi:hypothetical protein